MSKICLKVGWVMILCLMPWLVNAAGLGKLTLGSSLGQPFKAEIELVSVDEGELPSLAARVASPEAFNQAGMIYAPYHASLRVSIEKRVNGQPYIHVASTQSINEPFINLLVELSGSSSGRLLREYTVLLDPAETELNEPVVPVVQRASSSLQATSSATETIQPHERNSQKTAINSKEASYKPGPATYGPVERGETLTKIAKQVAPEGIDLNQMLVALYQANRDAFFENNMNLLKVGSILRIPQQSEIASVSQREASQEIKAQTANWHAYRQRIAEAATSTSTNTSVRADLKQSAEGKISTTIEEDSPLSKNAPSEEVLILSKGQSPSSFQDNGEFVGGKNSATQDYLRMMEEDAIAKERALQEANERITLLEQNIERLQRLIEIKGTGMAEIQARAEQLSPQAESSPSSEEHLVPDDGVMTDAIMPEEVNEKTDAEHAETTVAAQSEVMEAADQVGLPEFESTSAVEMALLDQIIDFVAENLEVTGGVLAALLTGWLGISILRRRRNQKDEMDHLFDYVDEEPEGNSKTTHATAATSMTAAETVPAVLSDRQHNDKESFVEFSEEAKFNIEKREGGLSESAAGFFFGKNMTENVVVDQGKDLASHQAGIAPSSPKESPVETSSETPTENLAEQVHDIQFDIKDSPHHGAAELKDQEIVPDALEQGREKEAAVPDLEFTLSSAPELDEKEDSPRKTDTSPDDAGIPFELDFPGEIASESPTTPSNDETVASSQQEDDQHVLTFDLSEIKLDLDEEPEKAKDDNAQTDNQNDIPWDEVAVKIDLAKAYLEMKDIEGAQEILEEVLREGTESQQATARSMLDSLK